MAGGVACVSGCGKDDGGRLVEETKVAMGGRHTMGAPGKTAFPHTFPLFAEPLIEIDTSPTSKEDTWALR